MVESDWTNFKYSVLAKLSMMYQHIPLSRRARIWFYNITWLYNKSLGFIGFINANLNGRFLLGCHHKIVGSFDNIDIGPWLSEWKSVYLSRKIGIQNSQLLLCNLLLCPFSNNLYKILKMWFYPTNPWNEYGFQQSWKSSKDLKHVKSVPFGWKNLKCGTLKWFWQINTKNLGQQTHKTYLSKLVCSVWLYPNLILLYYVCIQTNQSKRQILTTNLIYGGLS